MTNLFNQLLVLATSLPSTGEKSYIQVVVGLIALALALLGLNFWLRRKGKK